MNYSLFLANLCLAWRNLMKYRLQTCISILLGMAALILLTVFWQIWRAAKANAAEVIKE